ncbi:MAG: hypothetical protein EX271_00520 [Acidimicrobiales bacterium]|nr:hypothetical protein [Hyphomonadaceae bacterium]RZV44974.1 MAG: hypothetical protein EX271_00520 [Acidimicrobiales bacterium]
MGPIDTIPKLPYPAFEISRFAPLAAKISKENDFIAEAVKNDQQKKSSSDVSSPRMGLEFTSLQEHYSRLDALDAAEDYLKLAQDLNNVFQRTLDTYM